MSIPFVVLTEGFHQQGLDLLAASAQYVIARDADDLAQLAPEADGIIGRNQKISGAVIASGPRLKVVARHGVGLDSIDVATATAHCIPVVYTPEANAVSVAEHTIGMIFALARQLIPGYLAQSRGDYASRNRIMGMELGGKLLALIGIGRIGTQVAVRALALGLQVIAYDPALTPARAAELGVGCCATLAEALQRADFVSLHMPLVPETYRLINAERLALMKPTAYLINAARGPVIDEAALIAALEEGRIAGAALDVFDPEPPSPDNPLLRLPNVIVTPHTAAATHEAMARMAVTVVADVLAVLGGQRPRYLANPTIWEQRRR
jgi:D-3-phosphoglycerate dehydrogenase